MKIILDAYGGDEAPQVVIDGMIQALKSDEKLEVVLSGGVDRIRPLTEAAAEGNRAVLSRVEYLDAPDIITNDDSPTGAIRSKKNSSLVRALERLAEDEQCGAFVSAGSTGAVLAGAFMKLGRIKNVSRPALAPVLPTATGGRVILIDCGANVDCTAVNLQHFALMGTVYAEAIGLKNPRIGLLNNGTEDKKGNELTKSTFELLKASELNFIGNIEGRDILSGNVDVVVCDGFNGNIALKTAEGTAGALFTQIKDKIAKGGLRAKLGALLLKPALTQVKRAMDYNAQGGACFLGVKKVIVKSHGASKATSIAASLRQAKELAESGIVAKIEQGLQSFIPHEG